MTVQENTDTKGLGLVKKIAARGGIIAFFIIAFEVMIMISPFAFFFYSVFNPIFAWLDQSHGHKVADVILFASYDPAPNPRAEVNPDCRIHLLFDRYGGLSSLRNTAVPWENIQMGNRRKGAVRTYQTSTVSVSRSLGRGSGHFVAQVHSSSYPVVNVHPLLFFGKR